MEFDAGIQLPPSRSVALAVTESSGSPALASPLDEESLWQMSLRVGENINFGSYPERPGEPDCAYYLRTGLCRFGSTCRFNHPSNRKLAIARLKGGYPERVGQPECQYYLKTGTCKFGPTCKFHHPKEKSGITGRAQMNILGYPLRPNEKECAYYLRTGQCKFGNTCKFHHPQPSLRGSSSFYPSAHSPANPGQPPENWSLPKGSFVGPRWQGGPSSYTQLILPQGLVQVPNWSSFPTQFGSASSIESQQPNSGSSQFFGTSRQCETSVGSSASFASFRFGSIPEGQYAIQRDNTFPERPGEPECQYYMKTGDCKFGTVCRFHHPRERLIPAPNCVLNPLGLPLRPGEPLCVFYSRYGVCKFGLTCKFDHPIAAPMGIFTYSLAATPSSDIPIVRRLLGSSSGPPALAFSSDGSPETGPGKSRRLSSSDSQQMDSGDDNIESE